MRIGMLVDSYKPHLNGITNYVSLNKRVLESWGHDVYVFTFGDLDYQDDEPRVIRSAGVPLNIKDTGFHMSFRYSRRAQQLLRAMDVVHVHHIFQSAPLAFRYCRRRGIPIVYTNHTRFDLYAQHFLPAFVPDAVGLAFLQTYLPPLCRRCELVIAPSRGIISMMRELGVRTPIEVIPNGVDLKPFARPNQKLTRAEAGLPDDAVVLMYVGRLSGEKNLPYLLRAFFGVAAARPEALLALVGDGPEMDNLRDRVAATRHASRVKFFGRVEYEDVPPYLHLADAFVTASESEVHPLSLIEAMAAGLPALGIESPGIGDTIVDGENGLLSTPDLAEFTAKLMTLVTENDMRARLAAGALASVKAYDINHTARAVLQHYERLMAERTERLRGWAGLRQRLRNIIP